MKKYTITGVSPQGVAGTYATGVNEDSVQDEMNEARAADWRQMNAFIDDPHLETGKANMRGNINAMGIEAAAGLWADELAGPFNEADHARIRGAFLAAFEAGQLHQHTIENRAAR